VKKRMVVLVLSLATSSFGLVGFAAPAAHACAEIDPAIGCIGPCARPLQGSPTCPTEDDGKGRRP
jgi:hypothetical protein